MVVPSNPSVDQVWFICRRFPNISRSSDCGVRSKGIDGITVIELVAEDSVIRHCAVRVRLECAGRKLCHDDCERHLPLQSETPRRRMCKGKIEILRIGVILSFAEVDL